MRRQALALLSIALVTALLSGCISDAPGPAAEAGAGSPEGSAPPQGSAAGSPAAHGTPQRVEGPVDVEPQGGQFVATRVITVSNDFGGAPTSSLGLSSFNGAVDVRPSTDGGYRFHAELFARGPTEQSARDALATLSLDSTDKLDGGRLALSFALRSGETPVPLPIDLGGGTITVGAAFTLLVPPEPAHDLDARTANAAVAVAGLHGPELTAATSNAAIAVDGAFGSLDAATTNAAIRLQGTFHDVDADTTNGAIAADLLPTRTGRVELRTQNAAIDVQVPSSAETAYDVTGDTMNANVVIALDGERISSEAHATYRSPDFSSAPAKVTIVAATMNAGVSVAD